MSFVNVQNYRKHVATDEHKVRYTVAQYYRADEEKTRYGTSAKVKRGSAGRGFLYGSDFGRYKERVAMEYFGIRWTAVSPAVFVRIYSSAIV